MNEGRMDRQTGERALSTDMLARTSCLIESEFFMLICNIQMGKCGMVCRMRIYFLLFISTEYFHDAK